MQDTHRPVLYIVIDDVGIPNSIHSLTHFLSVPVPLTFAILPGLKETVPCYQMIIQSQHRAILHQPMAPENGFDPGPCAINVNTPLEDIVRLLSANFEQLPQVRGMNNHMGSYVTRDREQMRTILQFCKDHRIFFLDSLTTPKSVGGDIAKELGISYFTRDIFLDHEDNFLSVSHQLERAVAIAKRKGYAVIIGHIWSAHTYRILKEVTPQLQQEGIQFDFLENLFFKRED